MHEQKQANAETEQRLRLETQTANQTRGGTSHGPNGFELGRAKLQPGNNVGKAGESVRGRVGINVRVRAGVHE
eukprot:1841489-Lingulodinium_polyedra.AAC.1